MQQVYMFCLIKCGNLKNTIQARGFSLEDSEKFAQWAFGDEYKSIVGPRNFKDAWNNKNGDKLLIKGHDKISLSLDKMIDLYKLQISPST